MKYPIELHERAIRPVNEAQADWFGGLQVASDGTHTVIAGLLPDQPALHGCWSKSAASGRA